MAVEIKSGNGTDLATVDPVSKAIRVTTYDSEGNEIDLSVPVSLTVTPVTVVDNDIIDSFDASAYKFVSLQLTGTWVGEVKFQASADNGTWFDVASQNVGVLLSPYVISMTETGGVKIPVMFKYLRVRVTAYTSGVVEGVAFGHKQDSNTGQISSTGEVTIASGQSVGLSAGSAYIGDVKVLPTISKAAIPLKVISAVGTNGTLVQVGASNVHFILIVSTAATPRFVKFYDQATTPVVGTDVPTHTFPLAVGASPIHAPAGGFNFTNGFAYAIDLNVNDNGATPFTVAGEVVMMIEYT